MSKAVSVNRSKIFEAIVQKLSGEKAVLFAESGKKLFPTIREFLTFCALLGFQNDTRVKIVTSSGTEDIQGVIYEDTEALEFIWLIGLAETQNIELIQDGNERKCAEIFEEYANGGLQILHSTLSDTSEEHWPTLVHELTNTTYIDSNNSIP